jgi:hypothetical protein
MFKRSIVLLAAFALSAALVYAHGDATHLKGTITSIEGDHIQIKDEAGKPVMVMLDKATKYVKAEKPSAKTELKVGTRVAIHAKMDEKMKMYSAEEVEIGAAETKPAATMKAAAPAKTAAPAATKK